jgi:hypothetical protein
MVTVSKPTRVARTKNGVPPRECAVCHRPFEWRAKWRENFDDVLYCSRRCAREARTQRRQERA